MNFKDINIQQAKSRLYRKGQSKKVQIIDVSDILDFDRYHVIKKNLEKSLKNKKKFIQACLYE